MTKVESQKTEIPSFQRDLQSTQFSLNSWDEVKLNSIYRVHVDDSVGTSTSCVSRITGTSCPLCYGLWKMRMPC